MNKPKFKYLNISFKITESLTKLWTYQVSTEHKFACSHYTAPTRNCHYCLKHKKIFFWTLIFNYTFIYIVTTLKFKLFQKLNDKALGIFWTTTTWPRTLKNWLLIIQPPESENIELKIYSWEQPPCLTRK